jgi:hypothetical protein
MLREGIPISGCLTVSKPGFETVRQDYWTYGWRILTSGGNAPIIGDALYACAVVAELADAPA